MWLILSAMKMAYFLLFFEAVASEDVVTSSTPFF